MIPTAGVSLWTSPRLTGVIPAELRESRDRRVEVSTYGILKGSPVAGLRFALAREDERED